MRGDLLLSVTARQEYQDLLAPFDQTEDYSTASQLKNKGPNLTMEVLASLSVEEIIKELLVKASIIDYERLIRLLISACKLGKHPLPREVDVL